MLILLYKWSPICIFFLLLLPHGRSQIKCEFLSLVMLRCQRIKDTNIHLQKHKTKPVCYQMTENRPLPQHPQSQPWLRYFPQWLLHLFLNLAYKNNQEACAKKNFSCLLSANSPSIFTTLCSHTQIQVLMWSLYSAFTFHFSKVFWIDLKPSKETFEWQPELLN